MSYLRWIFFLFSFVFASSCFAQSKTSYLLALWDEDVRFELDVTNEQIESLDELNKSSNKQEKALYEKWKPHFKDPAFASEIKEDFAGLAEMRKRRVNEILLPHQTKRLMQLVFRKKMRQNGGGIEGLLDNREFLEAMNITPQQKQKLKTKSRIVRAKLLKDIEELIRKAELDSIEDLTDKQKKSFVEMLGAPMRPRLGTRRKISPSGD